MTVSTSRTWELNVGQLVVLAFRKAGLIEPTQEVDEQRAGWARQELDVIVKKLQTKGLFARVIDFETITLTGNTFEYAMADYVLDVVDEAMWINAQETDLLRANGEIPIQPISRQAWQSISSKAATGVPRMYFCDRTGSTVNVKLWPIPDDSCTGSHIRFQAHLLRGDTRDANATMDAEPYWEQYFIYALAHELAVASSLPMDRCAYLANQAEMHMQDCKGYSNQRTPNQIICNHQTSWSR